MTKTKFSWLYCLMAVLSLSLVFTSCHKDDDDDDSNQTGLNQADLIGVWKIVSSVEYLNGEKDEDEDDEYDEDIEGAMYIEFRSDGTMVSAEEEDLFGTHSQSVSVSLWKLDGNKIVTTTIDGENSTTIKSLNSTTLVTYEEQEDEDGLWGIETELVKVSALPDWAIESLKEL